MVFSWESLLRLSKDTVSFHVLDQMTPTYGCNSSLLRRWHAIHSPEDVCAATDCLAGFIPFWHALPHSLQEVLLQWLACNRKHMCAPRCLRQL